MALTLKLDRKAEILEPTVTRDEDGGPTTTFTVIKSLWCNRMDRSSRETRIFSALRSETTAIFTFRFFKGLTADHRIRCEGKIYNVQPPQEISRRQYVEVEAQEVPGL